MSFADPAQSSGRYHVVGGPGVSYASDREQAAWAELFRHFLDDGVDPFEVRRRVGSVDVDVVVLNLTDKQAVDNLGIDEADLVGDDYSTTQALAAQVRAAGFVGILAPSAALPGCRTLVLFDSGITNAHPRVSRLRQPPPRMADLLRYVRLHRNVPAAVRGLLATPRRGRQRKHQTPSAPLTRVAAPPSVGAYTNDE
jgi:RES domain-containing protein